MAGAASVTAGPPRIGLSPRGKRVLWVALLAVTVLAVMVIGVFPTQQYLAQRSEAARRTETLEQLRSDNAELQAQVTALGTDAEIVRLARLEHNFVYPGEETYSVLSPPASGPEIPAIWPFGN
jgi:cell division protein FtsB